MTDDKKSKDKIEEAEMVEEKAFSDTKMNPVDELQNIQNLINSNIAKIDKLKEDIAPVKEMLESLLQADLEYAELDLKAAESAKERTVKKKELMNTTNGRDLNEKLKLLKAEMKEAREALSTYLQEYREKTGFNEFEGTDGELRQIVFTAKLVRKTKLNWD